MKTSTFTWSRWACAASLSLSSLAAFAQETPTHTQKQVNLPQVTAEVCYTTSVADVRQLFTRWNDSLLTLDPAKVTADYSDDAVLLPTVSNKPRTTPAEIQDYFVHFLEKKPQGEINKSHVKIGCNKAYDVGVYTFALTGKDGVVQHVRARYSFVYEYKNGQWLISHHHSSAMPEAIETKIATQH